MKITRSKIVVAAGSIGVLLGLVWLHKKPSPVAGASPELARHEQESPRHHPIGTPTKEAPGPAPASPPPAEPDQPIIDEVTVDKTAVCRGEENFINVKARTGNGSDAFLAAHFVDPTTHRVLSGTRIPFRLEDMPERLMEVIVEGRGGTTRVASVPHIDVKDCSVTRRLAVETARLAERPDRVAFVARVMERAAGAAGPAVAAMAPSSYEWDFGDQSMLTTAGPEVEHSYESRDQSAAQSSFVVTVKAKDAAGNEVSGSRSVWFPNAGFLPLVMENRVAISVGVREANAADDAPEQIWLYHGYPSPVRIERVRVRETVLDAPDQPERETMSRDYAPEALLGFSELPRGQSVTSRDLTALQPSAETAVRYVDIVGHAADGRPASGTFTLLRPKPAVASN